MATFGWKIDLDKCIGCSACAVACKAEMNTAPGGPGATDYASPAKFVTDDGFWSMEHVSYRWVVTVEQGAFDWYAPTFDQTFVSMSCMHCKEPACVKACPEVDKADWANPANAIIKRADGIVLFNQASCIGCRYCEWVCPYGAPQFNPVTKKVEKCSACVHRILDGAGNPTGRKPACVETCVGGALEFTLDFGSSDSGKNAPPGYAAAKHTEPACAFTPKKGKAA